MLLLSLLLPVLALATTKQCVVEHTNNADDTPSIAKAFASCSKNAEIVFSKQYTYNAYTPISLTNLSHVTIRVEGNINLPNNISYVQHAINISSNLPSSYATPWFYFAGDHVSLIGSTNPSKGWINGFGYAFFHSFPLILSNY